MFNQVIKFENQVAEFFNAPYAVATDCCTHAIELCLRASDFNNIQIPTHTYISIPFTLIKTGKQWGWKSEEWQNFYQLGNTNIIDAAVFWKANFYVPGTTMALSFQYKKHLNTVKGGMILLDDAALAKKLKIMSYDGRDMSLPWAEQKIETVGYHYYMPPETASLGIERLPTAIATSSESKLWNWKDYPYLPDMPVFKNI